MRTKQSSNRLSIDELKKLLDYDPESGVFTWRERDPHYMENRIFNVQYAWTDAGSIDKEGRRIITIRGKVYPAAHLAIAFTKGYMPKRTQRISLTDDYSISNVFDPDAKQEYISLELINNQFKIKTS